MVAANTSSTIAQQPIASIFALSNAQPTQYEPEPSPPPMSPDEEMKQIREAVAKRYKEKQELLKFYKAVAAAEAQKEAEAEAARQAEIARQQEIAEQQAAQQAPPARSGSVWDDLAACESGGNWSINTGNGYYGGLQMDMQFWNTYKAPGDPERADLASRDAQIAAATRARDSGRGYYPWPSCARQLGLI